jgi:hypothetical protein
MEPTNPARNPVNTVNEKLPDEIAQLTFGAEVRDAELRASAGDAGGDHPD